ncbi:hypothetical protein [Bradyrhizobium sp. ORS 111]|uniref:hypothetical protein n=1 Tax=Bradyrhizobium sp. ORS 111 TaxID=1685958 RepID=UPI00388EE38E
MERYLVGSARPHSRDPGQSDKRQRRPRRISPFHTSGPPQASDGTKMMKERTSTDWVIIAANCWLALLAVAILLVALHPEV